MTSDFASAIRQLVQDKGISEDLVRKTIEDFLLAAYKRKFGSVDNAVVRFSEDGDEVTLYARKQIVEEIMDPVTEVILKDAIEYNEECELGDELLIEIDPKSFDRLAVQSAKQNAKQNLREIQKDTLYSEFKEKVGEMIIGYYQRERNDNIFVDLGKTEGILPRRFQSPREVYRPNDRLKCLIYEVNKTPGGLQIVLSRSHAEFVKKVFELEVPEIYDKTIEVFKIVREPGYRSKISVYSNRDDVDPVGACVGLKGVRIQAIVRELEGEKVDILKYDSDIRTYIKNALSPAEVSNVVLLDEAKKQALAVVQDNMLSLAIGKQGLNVRLANRLVDWSIDVKTEAQFEEMDIAEDTKLAVTDLFSDVDEEEITDISELPDIPEDLVSKLRGQGIEKIEELVIKSRSDLNELIGFTESDVNAIMDIIEENVEIREEDSTTIEEETASADDADMSESDLDSDVEYECPECGTGITADMENCPSCGVGLSFEMDEE